MRVDMCFGRQVQTVFESEPCVPAAVSVGLQDAHRRRPG